MTGFLAGLCVAVLPLLAAGFWLGRRTARPESLGGLGTPVEQLPGVGHISRRCGAGIDGGGQIVDGKTRHLHTQKLRPAEHDPEKRVAVLRDHAQTTKALSLPALMYHFCDVESSGIEPHR